MSDVWLNGSFVDETEAGVSVRDTGLLHGIGVFTTMRAKAGEIVRIDRHLQRIRESCETLFIPLLPKDGVIADAAAELLQRNQLADARMRLTVTRGVTQPDPLHGVRVDPTTLLTATQYEPYPAELFEKGMTVAVIDEYKLNPYDVQAGHKTVNYMSRLNSLNHAVKQGAGEALWFNVHNYLQSGCVANVFLVKGGTLLTPPTNTDLHDEVVRAITPYAKSNVLPGITRGAVIERAKGAGIEVVTRGLTITDLLEADEVFLTNSIMGVMPVCRVERRAVGSEKPGEMTRRLATDLEA